MCQSVKIRHNSRHLDFGDQITTEGRSEYLVTLLQRHMKTINLDGNLLWRVAVEICKQRYFGAASFSETPMTIYQQTNKHAERRTSSINTALRTSNLAMQIQFTTRSRQWRTSAKNSKGFSMQFVIFRNHNFGSVSL